MENLNGNVTGVISQTQSISGEITIDTPTLTGVVEISGSIYPTYSGETTITPSSEEQVVLTKGKVLVDDILINPIPQNYGRIAWNPGVTLTVY